MTDMTRKGFLGLGGACLFPAVTVAPLGYGDPRYPDLVRNFGKIHPGQIEGTGKGFSFFDVRFCHIAMFFGKNAL